MGDGDGRFLPGQHPITGHGNGGFRFDDMSHRGSLLVTPSGMRALSATTLEDIALPQLQPLLAEAAQVDLLLIGTGENMLRSPAGLARLLGDAGLRFDCMSTSAAVATYNVVQAEGRRVAAILLAVGKAVAT